MPIKVTCNQCGGVLHAPDDSAGKRGRCPTCGTVLTITGDPVPPAGGQFGAPAAHAHSPRPAAVPQSPVSNPWGSLPGGPDERQPPPVQHGPAVGPPRPTYEVAKEPPPRPAPLPHPPEPVPVGRGSKVPPDPRKQPVQDPFAKPGKPKDEQAVAARNWAKVRRGLGWVRTGVFFLLLSVLVAAGLPVLAEFGVKLPDQPGFLKVEGFSQAEEIRLIGAVGPLVLGLLCVLLGRLGVSAAPAASFARGPAAWSSIATVIAVGGFVAYAAITGLAIKDSGLVPELAPDFGRLNLLAKQNSREVTLADKATDWAERAFLSAGDLTGQIQGLGAAAFVVFGLLAEVWFVAALGRMGAALHHPAAAGRANRFVVLVGLLFAAKVLFLLASRVYFKPWFDANVWAKWADLDVKWKTVAVHGGAAAVGLLVAVLYWRMIGGVRRAIREQTDAAA